MHRNNFSSYCPLTTKISLTVVIFLLALPTLLLCSCQNEQVPASPTQAERVGAVAASYRFNLVTWEIEAVSSEMVSRLQYRNLRVDTPQSRALVYQYLAIAAKIEALENQLLLLRATTTTSSSNQKTSQTEVALTALHQLQDARQPQVERILENQVTSVLKMEGLGWLGTNLPPPAFQFTEPPKYLVVSPRDEIKLIFSLYLEPDMSVEEQEQLELAIEKEVENTSALVSPTGGFSTWPTMIVDRAGLQWILCTIAHEWVHVYLEAYPLGRHYYDNPDLTAINETVAQIVGDEIGNKVFDLYYNNLSIRSADEGIEVQFQSEERFDFNEEMRLTRETVDKLLAQSKILEAEEYMEERRQLFVSNGYFIRRLNQAYFAFHGSYRTGPAAPTDDPIAPRLRILRQRSNSLAEFISEVQDMSSLDDLLSAVPDT